MKSLTRDQARAWTLEHGYSINAAFGKPIAGEVANPLKFTIPTDAGRRVALARTLWEATGAGASTLLWITEWGVWPSGEHPFLADAARRGLGFEGALHDAPGHLVLVGEDDVGLAVLALALLFLWDCWVLPAGHGAAVFVSHDEFGVLDVIEPTPTLLAQLKAMEVIGTGGLNTPKDR